MSVEVDIDQGINIKFCFILGQTTTNTNEILKKVHGKVALFRSRRFEWFSGIWGDHECLEDEAHVGQPHSVCMSETIENVREHVTSDRRLTIQVLANELVISKEVDT